MNAKQIKCLELMVSGALTQREIAAMIGVNEPTISKWKKDKEFMSEYNSLMRMSFKAIAAKAFKTQQQLLDNADSDSVRASVAKDILDRAGYKPDNTNNFTGEVNLNSQITALADLINNPQEERTLDDD